MEVTDAEEDEADQPPQVFNLEEADAEFVVAQAEVMAVQQAILESIQDEVKVLANRELTRQRHAEVDALLDELDAEKAAEEAGVEHSDGAKLQQTSVIRATVVFPGVALIYTSQSHCNG
ncbi:Cysteinyl-tRNA synthetase [Hordeum vulgare]|nr:Cysteinyl-tRNA synthetase [Hordeum vulgare]